MPLSGLMSLSRLSFPPRLAGEKSNPSGASTVTLKSPASTFSKPNSPLASVTSVATVVPSGVCRVTVTPGTPSSPGSCTPFPLASLNTKSPILPGSGASSLTAPASTVRLFSPDSKDITPVKPLASTSLSAASSSPTLGVVNPVASSGSSN